MSNNLLLINDPAPVCCCACCDMRVIIPASFDAIEQLLSDFRQRCDCMRQHRLWFSAELLLREALNNAVVHGSRNDPANLVRCAICVRRRRLIIAVKDQGRGFDWRAARNREADASSCSGRGMEIFRTYATRVRFNDQGNAVTVIKDF